MQLRVTVKRLNKRRFIPWQIPEPTGIVGQVDEGFTFEGVEVGLTEIPNPAIGKWYRDRDGYFYWGGGVMEVAFAERVAALVFAEGALETQGTIPTWIKNLGVDKIWSLTQGENVKIAVLDTGYNSSIADLEEAVKGSAVFIKSVTGTPITVEDKYGHGSHCASLIGGRNKNFITSCAPKSDLYIGKISSQGAVSSYNNIVNAVQWAIDNKVDIISISYGGESNDDAMEKIIIKAVNNHNILVVAAIGDIIPHAINKPCFPALQTNCIAVGATNDQRQIAPVTIISPKTEINAPGQDILGYSLAKVPIPMTGTSQSTAIIAGICALIISRHKKLGKNYTPQSILDLIVLTSNPILGTPDQKEIAPTNIFQRI